MKINVETGKRSVTDDIILALKESELKATYCGKDPINPIAMIFEVNEEDEDKVIRQAEKIIKNKIGKSVSFRVVPHGSLVYFK